jgi:hypothetical protein
MLYSKGDNMTIYQLVKSLADRGIVTEIDFTPKMDRSFEVRLANTFFDQEGFKEGLDIIGKGKTRTEALQNYIVQIQHKTICQTDPTLDRTVRIYLWEKITLT